MTVESRGKLQSLLVAMPPNGIATSPMLKNLGISSSLVQEYVKNGWLSRVGKGAFKRRNDSPSWANAVHSIQTQLNLPVHVAAITALEAEGASHYLRLSQQQVFLFSPPKVTLPAWLLKNSWDARIEGAQSKLLPEGLGLREKDFNGIILNSSSAERAILECLHLAPVRFDLLECYHVAEGLLNLRPDIMQSILENCNSIKVKRLFLFMADKAGLPVMKHLDLARIDLGTGNRAIVREGAYNATYQLVLPKALVANV